MRKTVTLTTDHRGVNTNGTALSTGVLIQQKDRKADDK